MSKIEWTNETCNSIVGCNKVSPGCNNCYALPMAVRNAHNHRMPSEIREAYFSVITKIDGKWQWNGKTAFIKSALEKLLKWKKPRMIFVVSMGDLFHESVSFEWIKEVFDIICQTPQHTYQILTKRPERMLEFFKWWGSLIKERGFDSVPTQSDNPLDYYSPLKNIWLGVTTENQEQANKRIPILLEIPASVRFVSIEPMLSKIDLTTTVIKKSDNNIKPDVSLNALKGFFGGAERNERTKLDWVICGGESGSKARPMHPDWTRSLRDQCKDAKTPFFFKQWGELLPDCQSIIFQRLNARLFQSPNNSDKKNTYYKIGKKKAGRLLDGKQHNEMPILK